MTHVPYEDTQILGAIGKNLVARDLRAPEI